MTTNIKAKKIRAWAVIRAKNPVLYISFRNNGRLSIFEYKAEAVKEAEITSKERMEDTKVVPVEIKILQ